MTKWPDLLASVQPITFLFRKYGVSHILHFIWEVSPGGTRQGPGEVREERRESMQCVIKPVITVSTWSLVLQPSGWVAVFLFCDEKIVSERLNILPKITQQLTNKGRIQTQIFFFYKNWSFFHSIGSAASL